MLSSFLMASLLLGTAPRADAPPCGRDRHHIDLGAASSARDEVVCISAGAVTTFLFDSPIQAGSLQLEKAREFVVTEGSGRLLSLIPSNNLAPGHRLRLSVKFADGLEPVTANFALVVQPQSDRQVEISRASRALESCQQRLQTELTHAAEHQESLTQMAVTAMLREGTFTTQALHGNSELTPRWTLIHYQGIRLRSPTQLHAMFQLRLAALPSNPGRIRSATIQFKTQSPQPLQLLQVRRTALPEETLEFLLEGNIDPQDALAPRRLTLNVEVGHPFIIGGIMLYRQPTEEAGR